MKLLIFICILTISLQTADNVSAQWIQTEGPFTASILSMVQSKSGVFAGTEHGVYFSKDMGANWQRVNNGPPGIGIFGLASIDSMVFVATDGRGVYRSSNNGISWTQINKGLKESYIRTFSIIDNKLFVLPQGEGIFSSTDFGDNWTESDSNVSTIGFNSIIKYGTTLFAGSVKGLYRSSDGGVSWILLTDKLNILSLVVNNSYLYVSTYTGIYRSVDSGVSWMPINNGLANLIITTLVVSSDTIIIAGSRDNGIYRSTDNGASWSSIKNGLPYHYIRTLITTENNLFVGTNEGVYNSIDNGETWTQKNHGLPFAASFAITENGTNLFGGFDGGIYRCTFNDSWEPILQVDDYITALAIHDNIFIAGGEFGNLYLSFDTAKNWQHIINFSSFNIQSVDFSNRNIQSVAINGSILLAATANGIIVRSGDYGISWDTVKVFPSLRSLFVNGSSFFAGMDTGGIFRSTDQGTSWKQINNGLASNRVFVFDMSGTNLIAGTYDGVYFSIDNGDSWARVNNGFRDTGVGSLAIYGTNIFAGNYYGVFQSTFNSASWTPVNDGLGDKDIRALAVNGANLFAGTNSLGIWRRPLSEISGVKQSDIPKNEIVFHPNFPNPSSTQTTISFSTGKPEVIYVKVFDILGNKCADLYSGELESGNHSFEWNCTQFPAGIYTCLIESADGQLGEQPIVIK